MNLYNDNMYYVLCNNYFKKIKYSSFIHLTGVDSRGPFFHLQKHGPLTSNSNECKDCPRFLPIKSGYLHLLK